MSTVLTITFKRNIEKCSLKKNIKDIITQNILGFICYLYIAFVKISCKIHYDNENFPKHYWINKEPFILAFWHSHLMMIGYSWKINKKINILASGHSDGRFGAIIGKYLNLNNIQTSKKIQIYLYGLFLRY